MKLQIQDQQLRLRIDEDELQQLREGKALASTTVLPGGSAFRFQLELLPDAGARMLADGEAWRIALPTAAVDAYVGRLPCREGLDFTFPTSAGVVLGLAFEVDLRDSVRRRGRGVSAPRH